VVIVKTAIKIVSYKNKNRDITIVGCGFAAVALGISLKKSGFEKFIILERSNEIGGVWRENTYPGAACDVPSRLYSFSFEQDYPWSLRYAPQKEIFEYLQHCINKYKLTSHIRLNAEVTKATYNDQTIKWTLTLKNGIKVETDVFISAVGLFNNPFIPEIPGQTVFDGPQFHSSRWNHKVDFRGKTVASIGSGASAIQYVPEIAKLVKNLYVFQRTPQHIFSKGDRANRPQAHKTTLIKKFIYRRERFEVFYNLEKNSRRRTSWKKTIKSANKFKDYIQHLIKDPELLNKVIPNYPPGCKRGLRSDDWYPTLLQPHVKLINTSISSLSKTEIHTITGDSFPVDIIVYGTGFTPTKFLTPMKITGYRGQKLDKNWKEGAEAYLGMSVTGFPNFFMMYGPNTNLSGSIIYMLENQARYITECINLLDQKKARSISVKQTVQKRFNDEISNQLSKSILSNKNCKSYFRDPNGRITTNWPGLMLEYRWKTRRVRQSDFIFG